MTETESVFSTGDIGDDRMRKAFERAQMDRKDGSVISESPASGPDKVSSEGVNGGEHQRYFELALQSLTDLKLNPNRALERIAHDKKIIQWDQETKQYVAITDEGKDFLEAYQDEVELRKQIAERKAKKSNEPESSLDTSAEPKNAESERNETSREKEAKKSKRSPIQELIAKNTSLLGEYNSNIGKMVVLRAALAQDDGDADAHIKREIAAVEARQAEIEKLAKGEAATNEGFSGFEPAEPVFDSEVSESSHYTEVAPDGAEKFEPAEPMKLKDEEPETQYTKVSDNIPPEDRIPPEEPASFKQEVIPPDTEKEAEAKKTEEVLTIEEQAEKAAEQNEIYNELVAKKEELLAIPEPPKKGFLNVAYLFMMKPDLYHRYKTERSDFKAGQKELETIQKFEKTWVKSEASLIVEAEKAQEFLTEIAAKMTEGTATKEEQKKATKLLAKLDAKRDMIDISLASEVNMRLHGDQIPDEAFLDPGTFDEYVKEHFVPEREEWEGVKVGNKFKESEKETKQELIEAIKSGDEKSLNFLLSGLSPESQEAFFKSEAGASLRDLAQAKVLESMVGSDFETKVTKEVLSQNPRLAIQLFGALRLAAKNTEAAKKQVELAMKRASKDESFAELKVAVLKNIKRNVGEVFFETDDGLVVEADTGLSEIALNGHNSLASATSLGMESWGVAKLVGNRIVFGALAGRRSFNDRFAKIIPESNHAVEKVVELDRKLADLEVSKEEIDSAIKQMVEVRATAGERKRKLLELAEQDKKAASEKKKQDAVDKIIDGVIDVLDIPKQSKGKLQRVYDKEGLSDTFLDLVIEYYQKSKLATERKRTKLQDEMLNLALDREKLLSQAEAAAEKSSDDVVEDLEKQITQIERLIDQKEAKFKETSRDVSKTVRDSFADLEDKIGIVLDQKYSKQVA